MEKFMRFSFRLYNWRFTNSSQYLTNNFEQIDGALILKLKFYSIFAQ